MKRRIRRGRRPRRKLQRIHVNRQVIDSNRKNDENEPPLRLKTYNSNTPAHELAIIDGDGIEVARVVYRPDKPLSCGARLWIETKAKVIVDPEY